MIRIAALFMTRNIHSAEFQEQALSKVRQLGTGSVQNVAKRFECGRGCLVKVAEQVQPKELRCQASGAVARQFAGAIAGSGASGFWRWISACSVENSTARVVLGEGNIGAPTLGRQTPLSRTTDSVLFARLIKMFPCIWHPFHAVQYQGRLTISPNKSLGQQTRQHRLINHPPNGQ